MPTNFEIHIFGVSLCFYKEPYWNVIFPCDGDHRATACFNGASEDLCQDERVIFIDFPIEAIEENAKPYESNQLPLFNMSANYAHGVTGTPGASTLNMYDLTQVRDPNTLKFSSYVWIRVPYATMLTQIPTPCHYYVQDVSGAVGLPVEDIGTTAREVVFVFTTTKDISLVAEDLRDPKYSASIFNPLPSTAKNVAEIDNDCHSPNSVKANDFLNLYKIVYDAGTPMRKFAAGQMKCANAPQSWIRPSYCIPAGTPEEEKSQLTLMSTYGNCDPVESNPPPGP
jgi:hypothetical protein